MALGWNCRGLGNPRSVGMLRSLVRRWDPEVVFLSETKMTIAGMRKLKMKLGFVNGLYVQRKGRGGGLAMYWKKEVNLEIKSYSRHHIDAVVVEEESGFKWRLTGFYGHPETHGKALRPQNQMEAFRNIIHRCGFKDLGFSGFEFKWCNQQEGENRMYLRLDRVFATMDWLEHF